MQSPQYSQVWNGGRAAVIEGGGGLGACVGPADLVVWVADMKVNVVPPPGSLGALMGIQNTRAGVHLRERRSIQPARGEGAAMEAMGILVGAFRAGWTLCL